MNYHINFCEIASAYLLGHLKINQVAERYQIPKSTVVKSLFKYIEAYPDGNYSSILYRKFKIEIVKNLLEYEGSGMDFANEYGMTVTKLMTIVSDFIQDKKLVASDKTANSIYVKLISGKSIYLIKYIPSRIINYIGNLYINGNCTYMGIARLYCCNRSTISRIIRRGIAENIFSDQLAEEVYTKARINPYQSDATTKCYELAFEERKQNKQTS